MRIVETTAADYYGAGYQDVQNRVPKIANTCADLDWQPTVPMERGADADLRRVPRPGRRGAEARRMSRVRLDFARPAAVGLGRGSELLLTAPSAIPLMHLALKIDVDTLRGTREGVPGS